MNEKKHSRAQKQAIRRASRVFVAVLVLLTVCGNLSARTLEEAMDKAAAYFIQDAVKIPYGQKLYISKIVNLNSKEQDRLGKEIESELYFAFERKRPDYKLQLGDTTGKKGDVYITGTYEPQGDEVEIKLRVIEEEDPPLILAQYEIMFRQEVKRSRVLVAILDLEAEMLGESPKKAFSEIFRSSLSQKNAFDIVNSAEIDKLDPNAVQEASGCTRDECATIIGEQLGVDRVISTSLFKVDENVFVLSGKIINIVDGAIIKSRTVKHTGDLSSLDISIEKMAVLLTEGESAERKPVFAEPEEKPSAGKEIREIIAQSIRESQEEDGWSWNQSSNQKKSDPQPSVEKTSQYHRETSFLYVGVSPFDLYNPSVVAMPYTVGLYLGDSMVLGVEQFTRDYDNGVATATATGRTAFIRFFTGNLFNMKVGFHERSIESAVTIGATTASEIETREYISFGIGNQWITDAGITLGGDWVFYAKPSGKRTYTTENNGGSNVAVAENAISVLKNGINVYDFGFGLVTFSIGFTF